LLGLVAHAKVKARHFQVTGNGLGSVGGFANIRKDKVLE
jgi:hypothetical protein